MVKDHRAKFVVSLFILLSGAVSCLGGSFIAENPRKIIPSGGKHRGFPRLLLYEGVYYLGYREAEAHLGRGIGHVLYSTDGSKWSELLSLKEQGTSIGSPRCFKFKNSLYIEFEYVRSDSSVFSAYIVKMPVGSLPVGNVSLDDIVLTDRMTDKEVLYGWQARTYQGKLYNPFYWRKDKGSHHVSLMVSNDGINWKTVVRDFIPVADETGIIFHGDKIYAIARVFGPAKGSKGAIMNMKTLEVERFDFNKALHAPVIFNHDGNDYVMGRACGDKGQYGPYSAHQQQYAVLYQVDWKNHNLNWVLNLPYSAGRDNGYTAIAPMDKNRYLVAYYATNKSGGGVYAHLPSIWTCELVYKE